MTLCKLQIAIPNFLNRNLYPSLLDILRSDQPLFDQLLNR